MDLRRSKVRLSRALGVALTAKAARVMERWPTRPGQHGRGRIKDTDYETRLLEKQRLCAQYNIGERQLRRAVKRAMSRPGRTGEELLSGLETRLDALMLRAGYAPTIYQARQAVSHGRYRESDGRLGRPAGQEFDDGLGGAGWVIQIPDS